MDMQILCWLQATNMMSLIFSAPAPPDPRKRVAATIVRSSSSDASASGKERLGVASSGARQARQTGEQGLKETTSRIAPVSPVAAAESSGVKAASAAEEMAKENLLPPLNPLP